ncbi:hypothetical protein [Acidaminococcus intestini]|uniref:hypothetical protein n=1 Tax=Acidaminococcus intestini TaxID=187327 RepID=UPI003AB1EC1D
MEKISKIGQLYNLYVADGAITNDEAAEAVGSSNHDVRTMKYRLKSAGYIDIKEDGTVEILKPFRSAPTTSVNSMKSGVYSEMIEAYLEDFREQTTFADRLAVGREIRLLLDKL